MRNIAIGEDNNVNLAFADDPLQIVFFYNRNSFGIQRSREFCGILTTSDIRNLCSRKRDYSEGRVVAKYHIKVVEVSTGGAQDQHFFHGGPISERCTLYARSPSCDQTVM